NFSWRNSLRIAWTEIQGHLCIFANGTGDLTLLIPPIGDTNSDAPLRQAYKIMDDYNSAAGVPDRSRVEYISEELLARFSHSDADITPLGMDYLYDVKRMIDLAGGDSSSKRQAKDRVMRNYGYHVERYDREKHLAHCRRLLLQWKLRQDEHHEGE